MANPIACKAVEILETSGWTQDSYQNDKGQFCLMGAISQAVILTKKDGQFSLLGQISKKINPFSPFVATSIIGWNDTPGRTKEEVIDMLKEFC